jgi:hypothetical protein
VEERVEESKKETNLGCFNSRSHVYDSSPINNNSRLVAPAGIKNIDQRSMSYAGL